MKPTLLSGIIAVVLGAFFGFTRVHQPTEQRLNQLARQLAEEQESQQVRVEIAKLVGEVEQFRKRLAPEPEAVWLVREVGRLAEEAHVQLSSIAPQPPRPVQEFTRLVVAIQFDSSYHDLGQFLSVIESSNSFIRVDELAVSRQTRDQDHPLPAVTLTLSTLYLPPFSISGRQP